jgi:hypothetical protein
MLRAREILRAFFRLTRAMLLTRLRQHLSEGPIRARVRIRSRAVFPGDAGRVASKSDALPRRNSKCPYVARAKCPVAICTADVGTLALGIR